MNFESEFKIFIQSGDQICLDYEVRFLCNKKESVATFIGTLMQHLANAINAVVDRAQDD